MIYTAVFQDRHGVFSFESHVATHDRNGAWHEIHDKREDENTCLILLIDGHADVKTFADIVDNPR
tara:strand:- start:315 stop:509 length:195 start_codon:yes stop_codon:yes gene_type:complete